MKPLISIAAGLFALALAYLGNRVIWLIMRGKGIAWCVPFWEEFVKTTVGILTGQVFPVHALFGLGEAIVETGRGDAIAGVLAMVSHACFGLLTLLTWRRTGQPAAGLLAAALAHAGWNRLILCYAKR